MSRNQMHSVDYPRAPGDQITCFSHIQKAGGSTVEVVLRRHFGPRHMLVNPPRGWIYRERDLRADLRLNPWTRSIGSHWLRPFEPFGEFEERMAWFVFLREPISRFLSHFQYHVERMGFDDTFERWIEDPIQHNWQTRYLAGEPDLEAAKQILAGRYRAVGLVEHFDESLLLVRSRLGLHGLDPWYGEPHNQAKSRSRRSSLLEQHRDLAAELNQLDRELYRFARDELYPKQVSEYGEHRLKRDLTSYREGDGKRDVGRMRELGYLMFRRGVHLPVQSRRAKRAVRRGEPDIRK